MSTVVNFMYDKRNDFGLLTTAGDSPDIINMGEASAERMTVDLKLPEGDITSASGVTVKVMGGDSSSTITNTIVQSGTVAAADLNKEGYSLPIPKTKYKFLKVNITGFTAGKIQAIINSYLGK